MSTTVGARSSTSSGSSQRRTASTGEFVVQKASKKFSNFHPIRSSDCGGHAPSSTSASIIGVRYGTSTREKGGTLLAAKYVGYHDKYVHELHQHDVALIQVAKDIVFSGVAKPVRMVDVGAKLDSNAVLTVSGWGSLHVSGA